MVTPIDALSVLFPDAAPLRDYSVSDDGKGAVISAWNLPDPQPTPEQLAAVTEAQVTAARLAKVRAAAKALYDSQGESERALRAVAKLAVDEINALRAWVTSFKAAVAAATNLADLKTRVAALANTPARTYEQAKAAVASLIDGE